MKATPLNSTPVGGDRILFMCCLSLGEKKETHIQNSQEISGQCRDSPGTIPEQSREIFVAAFSRLLFVFLALV